MTQDQYIPEENAEDAGQDKSKPEIDINVEDLVQADIVEISQGGANQIQAKEVTIRQGGANKVQADVVQVRQGGIVKADAGKLELLESGLVYANVQEDVHMTASNAGVLVSKGNVKVDQGGIKVLVSKGDVSQEQCGTVFQVSNSVTMDNNSATVFLFAKKVEGEVHTSFGQRESILFGIMAGIGAGIVMLISSFIKKKKR